MQKVERAVFVILSILLIFFSIIGWVAVHQAGPPPAISVLLTLLPFALITTAVDSLARLAPLTRSVIGILTCLLALAFLYIVLRMWLGWEKGDVIIPLAFVLFFGYYNLRINPWWGVLGRRVLGRGVLKRKTPGRRKSG